MKFQTSLLASAIALALGTTGLAHADDVNTAGVASSVTTTDINGNELSSGSYNDSADSSYNDDYSQDGSYNDVDTETETSSHNDTATDSFNSAASDSHDDTATDSFNNTEVDSHDDNTADSNNITNTVTDSNDETNTATDSFNNTETITETETETEVTTITETETETETTTITETETETSSESEVTMDSYNDSYDNSVTVGNIDAAINSSVLEGEVAYNNTENYAVSALGTATLSQDNSVDGAMSFAGVNAITQNTGSNSLTQSSVNIQSNLSF